jgi:arsenate reductase
MADADVLQLLHNPGCSKSRRALELLRDRGAEPEVRRYLDAPLDADELLDVIRLLDGPASSLVREREARDAGLAEAAGAMRDAEVASWLAAHPAAMQRPVLIHKSRRAIVARPPERVFELLHSQD